MRRVAVLIAPLVLWGCAAEADRTADVVPTTALPTTAAPATEPPATTPQPTASLQAATTPQPTATPQAATTPQPTATPQAATTPQPTATPQAATTPPTAVAEPVATAAPAAPTTAPTTTTPLVTGAAAAFSPDHLMVGPGSFFESADDPLLVPASVATWLEPDDVVLGVLQDGEAAAFPVDQMAYHHIANTTVAGEPYLVTY